MSPLEDNQLCERLGEDTISAIVAAFYRQVPDDAILGALYPAADFAGAEARLKSFLIFRFGGSQKYLEERGHPKLRIRHAPFIVNTIAKDRWIQLMNVAIVECQIAEDAAAVMRQFFDTAATFLINSPDA